MKIESAKYQKSAAKFEACPVSKLPEFAFVGRSNVGKSSLINLLAGKKELAKTSSVTGKTKLISFFNINGSWTLVDLPGYGFAKVSKTEQHHFNEIVSEYLTCRENLKHVFLLVDSRLESQESDFSFMEWMEVCAVPFSVVFTKTDKSSEGAVDNRTDQFLKDLTECGIHPEKVFHTSAKENAGRGPILQSIEQKLPKQPKKAKGGTGKLNLSWMNRAAEKKKRKGQGGKTTDGR